MGKSKTANKKRLKRLNAKLERHMVRPHVFLLDVFVLYIYIYIYIFKPLLHKYSLEILKVCSKYIKRSLDTSQHGMKPNCYKTNNFINHIVLKGNNGRTVDDEIEAISKNDLVDVKLTSDA